MGKIRVAALGDEELEKQQAVAAKKRREAKKEKKGEAEAEDKTEQSKAAEQPEKESKKDTKEKQAGKAKEAQSKKKAEKKGKEPKEQTDKERTEDAEAKRLPPQVRRSKTIGKNRKAAVKLIDPNKTYALSEAIALLRKASYAKFDETVELHLNLKEGSLKGEVTLPHGTGKEIKVAIASEKLLADIEQGKIDFDILIAAPTFMPKLVPFAKILGPKGLMPNPKNGTVSDKPEEAAKKFKGGSIRYKSEAKAPILHQAIGKMSFKDDQIIENARSLVDSVQSKNILSAYISASMTPSVRFEV